jgi:hypothetical protein
MASVFNPGVGKDTRWKKGGPSPNPGGRPKSAVLSAALRAKLSQVKPDDPEGRLYAEVVAANLVELACSQSRNSVAAISEILDRTEGRPHQSLAIADVTAEVHSKSDDDLRFYLDHGCWPDREEETPSASGTASA